MKRRVKRPRDTAQRGLGFQVEPAAPREKKSALSEDFFLPDDPRGTFIADERLEVYLRRNGQGWVLRLRELVEDLDYSALLAPYQARGRRAISPRALVGLILYGIMQGHSSLRELETLAVVNLGAWWVSGRNQPDHSTIGKFIQTHAAVLTEEFFMGLVKSVVSRLQLRAATVAADGTVIEAAASRYSLLRAEAAREAAKEARRQAQSAPEDEQAAAADRAASQLLEVVEERAQKRRDRGREPDTVRVAPAELDAVVQPRKDGVMRPSYKPSIMVHESGLIVGQHVEASNEIASVQPMLAQHAVAFEAMPTTVLLDAGYFSGELLESMVEQDLDVLCPPGRTLDEQWEKKHRGDRFPKEAFLYEDAPDVYRCPQGQSLAFKGQGTDRHGRAYRTYANAPACRQCEMRARCTKSKGGRVIKRYEHDDLKEAMRQVLAQGRARERYRHRSALAETPFATIGHQRGLKRFRRRGLTGVRVEFALHCMAFDLRKALAQPPALLGILTVSCLHADHGRRLLAVLIFWIPLNP